MYKRFFGLKKKPFSNTPTELMFYERSGRGDLIEVVVSLLMHGDAIIKLTGDVGAGKTTLVRNLIVRLEKENGWNIAYVPNPSMGPLDMLKTIYEDLSGESAEGMDTEHALYKAIYEVALQGLRDGRKTLLVVDEAHHAPIETLEKVRLLANLEHAENNIIQVVISGQLELDDVLARKEMKAFASRISHSFKLEPLEKEETLDYLNHRANRAGYQGVLFSKEVADRIWEVSQTGTPRRLNIVADKTLIVAAANQSEKPKVEHVERVAKELLEEGDDDAPVGDAGVGASEKKNASRSVHSGAASGFVRAAIYGVMATVGFGGVLWGYNTFKGGAAFSANAEIVAVPAVPDVRSDASSVISKTQSAASAEDAEDVSNKQSGMQKKKEVSVKVAADVKSQAIVDAADSAAKNVATAEVASVASTHVEEKGGADMSVKVSKEGSDKGELETGNGGASAYLIHVATVSSPYQKEQALEALRQVFGDRVIVRPLKSGGEGVFVEGFGSYTTAKRSLDKIPVSLARYKPYILGKDFYQKIVLKNQES